MARLPALRDRAGLAVMHGDLRGHEPSVRGSHWRRHDRGSANPVIVAVLAVVMVLTAALAQVGAGLIASARASGAADLSALAAAQEDRDLRALGAGSARALDQACDVAEQVSRRNGATLTACARAAGSSVVVSVSVPVPGWPTPARARARAGPAWG